MRPEESVTILVLTDDEAEEMIALLDMTIENHEDLADPLHVSVLDKLLKLSPKPYR